MADTREIGPALNAFTETVPDGPANESAGSIQTNPDDSGGGGVVAEFAGPACLTYQPGGGRTGPVVFDDWTALVTRLDALRVDANEGGCFEIRFDDTFVTPAVIPPGFYDMRNVTWKGRANAGGNFVEMADGTVFLQLKTFDGVIVTNQNTAVSPCGDIGAEDGSIVTLKGGAALQSVAGAVPMYEITNLASVVCLMREGSFLGLSEAGPVFSMTVAGSFLFISLEGISGLNQNTVLGAVGAFLQIATSTTQPLPTVFPNWAGTVIDPRLDDPASVLPNPYLAAPSGAALVLPTPSQWLRLNPAGGGNIAQVLPSISGASNSQSSPGEFLIVTNYDTVDDVELSPGAGDTLNGGAGPLVVRPGETVMLISDGVSDWRGVSKFGSSNVNELWGPRIAPHPADDEFNRNAIDASWSQTGFSALDFSVRPAVFQAPVISRASWENLRDPDNTSDPSQNSWLRIQPGGGISGLWKRLDGADFGGVVPANLLAWTRFRFPWRNANATAGGDNDIALSFFEETGAGFSFAVHATIALNETAQGAVANVIKPLFWGRNGAAITNASEGTRMNNSANNRSDYSFYSGYIGLQKQGATTYHAWILDDGGRLFMGTYTNAGLANINAVALWCRGNALGALGIPIFDMDFVRFYEGDDWVP